MKFLGARILIPFGNICRPCLTVYLIVVQESFSDEPHLKICVIPNFTPDW